MSRWCGTAKKSQESRNRIYAAIHTRWNKLRRDLRHRDDDSRDELHRFAESQLGLGSGSLDSLTELSNDELCRLADALRRELESAGESVAGISTASGSERVGQRTVGSNVIPITSRRRSPKSKIQNPKSGDVVHLAGAEQLWAIERLFQHLGWDADRQTKFIQSRFKDAPANRSSAAHLSPQQANSLMFILLRIAASRDIKKLSAGPVSKAMVAVYVPRLKERLGIDRRET